jgi:exodeoxyribonuclease VII large subunit
MTALLSHPDTPLPLTITQVSTYLKQYIEKGFSQVCIQGEISGCKQHTSGHTYFSLKDEQSVIDAICWRGTRVSTPLKDGELVVCKGRITTYGARSKYQFIAESVEPAGQGALLQMIEVLKAKLMQEGLFHSHRKKPLPPFPQCIGLITSPTGAVIQDMMTRFSDRLPCRLWLYPVAVQGTNAVPDILRALQFFHSQVPQPDVLIIARGGGSIEDLWAFHDESLVRAVAASSIPIISAIGHETDTTLMDHAADYRAPTPTAAAEIVLPLISDLQEQLYQSMMHLRRSLHHGYSVGHARLGSIIQRLEPFQSMTLPLEQRLDDLQDMLAKGLSQWMVQRQHRWALAAQALGNGGLAREISDYEQRVVRMCRDLRRLILEKISTLGALMSSYERLLPQLSYQQTLERGFALVLDSHQKVCSSKEMAETHAELTIRFHDGSAPVHVKKKPV